MDDLTSAPQGTETAATETGTGGGQETSPTTQVQQQQPQEQSSGGENPAWAPLKEKLGLNFGLIQDDLKQMDKAAQDRITSVNQQYAPFKALVEQGYTPQAIQQALQIAHEIETDPVAFNTKYQEYLRVTGRLPQTAGEVLEAEELEEDAEEEDQNASQQESQALQQLRQEQANMRAWVQQQQFEQSVSVESQRLDQEVSALKQAHPELTDEDVKDIIRQAAAIAATTKKVPSLEEASQSFLATRNRILSTPRAGDTAPKLLPTSGGTTVAGGERKSLGQLTNQETTDLLAGLIAGHKG